jgi:coenzyme PQQ precursor peptide PqqA
LIPRRQARKVRLAPATIGAAIDPEEPMMAWTAPKIEEFSCGMEINMYAPAEDDRGGDLF